MLIGDDGTGKKPALGLKLAEQLTADGARVLRAYPGAATNGLDALSLDLEKGDGQAWDPLWRLLADERRPVDLVYLHALGGGEETAMDAAVRRCQPAADLLRGLAQGRAPGQTALTFVTQDAYDLPATYAEGPARLRASQAALVGLARVHQNENPEVPTRVIDLHAPTDEPGSLAADLAREILAPDGEDEVILGKGRRLGLRVKQQPKRRPMAPSGENDMHRVLAFTSGSLDNLHWTKQPRPAPGSEDVEIAVQAASLNFRDVMFAMGLLPHEALENGYPTISS